MTEKPNSTFECQRFIGNKNVNFNTKTTKEYNGKRKKVENKYDVHGKPFERDEKL